MKKIGVLFAGAILLILGGVAYASIPGPDGVIHGCYKNSNPAQGAVIVVDHTASCPSGKSVLSGGGQADRDLAVMRGSAPTNPSPPSLAAGWTVRFKFIGDAADTVTVDAWATCATVAA